MSNHKLVVLVLILSCCISVKSKGQQSIIPPFEPPKPAVLGPPLLNGLQHPFPATAPTIRVQAHSLAIWQQEQA